MKLTHKLLAVIALGFFGHFASAADCNAPEAPEIPDGTLASEEKMIEAQQEVKAFVAEGQQYLGCIKDREMAQAEEATEEERQALVEMYNNMVDKMKTASNEFNQAVRDFQSNQEEAE